MPPPEKSPGTRPGIILNYSNKYEPHVVAAIHEKHNIAVFLSFFAHPLRRPTHSITQFL